MYRWPWADALTVKPANSWTVLRSRTSESWFVCGTLEVHLPKTYYGVKNKQRRSDVRLIIHGRDRSDLIRFT